MERKYEVTAAFSVIPMVIFYKKTDPSDSGPKSICVNVNYAQDQVIFDQYIPEGIDREDLEQEILAYLRPTVLVSQTIPADLLDKINKVRSGEYQDAFKQPVPEEN